MGLSHPTSTGAALLAWPHVCGQVEGVLGAGQLLLAANGGRGVPGIGPGVAGAALRTVLAMRVACGA